MSNANRFPLGHVHNTLLLSGMYYALRLDVNGNLMVSLTGAAGNVTPADNLDPGQVPEVISFGYVFDGTFWDRLRGTSVAGAANVAEQQAPQAEDNTNGILATVPKPLAVSTYCASLFTQLGTDPDVSVKATPGNVFSCYCHNLNGAVRYLQLHNKATAPANPDVPLFTFLLPAQSAILIGEEFFGQSGMNFSTGIAYGFSTTEATYTAGAAGDQFAHIRYK